MADTNRFLYSATTSFTLRLAADLMDYGFDAATISRRIEQISYPVARLSGYVFEQLTVDEEGAGKVILSNAVQQKLGVVDSETSAVVALPGKVAGVVAWALFVEQPEGYYRVRIRSKGPTINEIAKRHHGGGHLLASGANAANLAEVEEIYKEIQAVVAAFNGN